MQGAGRNRQEKATTFDGRRSGLGANVYKSVGMYVVVYILDAPQQTDLST